MEKETNSVPSQKPDVSGSDHVSGIQPKYVQNPKNETFNFLEDKRLKLRVGLLILIALLLVATTGGYAYLYHIDQKIISILSSSSVNGSSYKKIQAVQGATPSATSNSSQAGADPKLNSGVIPQKLKIIEWGITLTLPNEQIFPKPSYALLNNHLPNSDSVGLSSGELSKYGGNCIAAGAPLGTLVRFTAGSFPTGGSSVIYITTIKGNSYGFTVPLGTCDKAPASTVRIRDSLLNEMIGAFNTLTLDK